MARIDSMYPESVKVGKPLLSELPKGWEQKSLDNYLNLESRKVNLENDKEYDLVTVKRSRGGVVRREHLKGRDISVKSQFYIKEGDFLISKRQIVHGACGIVPRNLNDSIVSNEYSVFTAKENFYLPFLEYLSETLYFQQVCFHSSIGVHIEKMIFKLDEWFKWSFNIPPLAEQKKIAEILSTWDKAIETVEKLVANSQQQKKALMQQLLTGQKRLLDENGVKFKGEWEELQIKEIGAVVTGSTPPKNDSNNYNGNISWATAEDFKGKYVSNTKLKLTELGAKKARILPKGAVLVTCIASIGKNAIADEVMGTNQQINAVIVNENNSNEFLYYQIEFNVKELISLAGITAVPIVNKSSFEKIKLSMPSLKEQEKIAQVLRLADREIDLYKEQLDKLKLEKKSLMQQLLTGQKRVKLNNQKTA